MLIILSLIIFTFFLLNKINFNQQIEPINQISFNDANYDILEPKFTINTKNDIISITADKGNFMSNNDILLKNNVLFKSKNFTLYSDYVIYNKNTQSARSKKDAIFISEGTNIQSEGFNINEQGDIIKFNGKSKIILNR